MPRVLIPRRKVGATHLLLWKFGGESTSIIFRNEVKLSMNMRSSMKWRVLNSENRRIAGRTFDNFLTAKERGWSAPSYCFLKSCRVWWWFLEDPGPQPSDSHPTAWTIRDAVTYSYSIWRFASNLWSGARRWEYHFCVLQNIRFPYFIKSLDIK